MRLIPPLSLVLGACALTAFSAPAFAQGQPLFRDVAPNAITRTYAEEAPVQQRNMRFDGTALQGNDQLGLAPQDVSVELFQGQTLQLHYLGSQTVGQTGNVHHYGVIGGTHFDYAAFSVVGNAMSGTIRNGVDLYTIRHVGGGELTLSQVDEFALLPCGGAFSVGVDAPQQGGNSGDGMGSETVDLLIVYTEDATSANGGHDGVFSLANLSVWETNYSYANSDVDQRVNLVGCQEVTGYTQSGSQSTDLSRLRATADGQMDEIHGWRDDYGADFVDLFISGYGSGVAYLMNPESAGFEDDAFSVCRDTRAASSYTLAHELGHNMGCHHDSANAGSVPLAAYAYGAQTSTNSYRSVMAYPPGTRVQQFSNPDKHAPDGLTLGNSATADNARVLDETVDTTAAFRPANESGHRVTTLFASNNGQSGNMFDILPATDMELHGIYINTSLVVAFTTDVWYRPGTYEGNENSSAGWTKLGTFGATGLGTDAATYLSFTGIDEVVFEAGQSYGIYVDMTSGTGIRYTNGAIRTYSNNFLQITSGVGKGAGFGATFGDRIWNGTISYSCSEGTDSLTTTFADNNGFSGNMFDVTAKNDVRVHGFSVNVDGVGFLETLAVDVYMKNGTYVGFEDDTWAWTYVGTDYRSGGSLFGFSIFQIEMGSVDLVAGQDYAFYLHCATYNLGHTMRYTNGSDSFENTDLIVDTGVGKGDSIFTGSTFVDRTWNGTIWYTVDRPRLSIENLVAGQQAIIRTTNGSPNGRNFVSWSTGNGPISSAWGTVFLNSNYNTLAPLFSNSAGEASLSVPVQSGTTGITIYLQGLDVPSFELTNGVAATIQ